MRARPGTRERSLKLTDGEWDALAAIAAREGLTWGGIPSQAGAIRWLIARDAALSLAAGDDLDAAAVDGEPPPPGPP